MTVSFCSEVDFEPDKGAFLGIIELCYFGRFIFGCGGETLSVAQKGFIAQWFDQKSLNFVLGLQLSFARIGEYVDINCQSLLANHEKLLQCNISYII